jgi:hypothetical protein
MSSIQSVQSGSNAALLAAAAKSAKAPAPAKETAAQESQETVSVTRSEAQKGDQQAVRKLAQEVPQGGAPQAGSTATKAAPRESSVNIVA